MNRGGTFYLSEALHDPCADVTAKTTFLLHLCKLRSEQHKMKSHSLEIVYQSISGEEEEGEEEEEEEEEAEEGEEVEEEGSQ